MCIFPYECSPALSVRIGTSKKKKAQKKGFNTRYIKTDDFINNKLLLICMARTSFGYYGGKSLIAKEILKYFPEHKLYIEVFGGSGELLFQKTPSQIEIYNDIDSGLVSILRCLLNDKLKKQLIERLMTIPPSRELFNELKKSRSKSILDKAFRKLYLLTYSYNADCDFFVYFKETLDNKRGVSLRKLAIRPLEEITKEMKQRNIVIENKDFRKIIPKFDKKQVLFYLDPPYYDCNAKYEYNFNKKDHEDLCKMLKNLKYATFFLSYNKNDTILEMYGDFFIKEFSFEYNTIKKDKKIEIVISNRQFQEHNIFNHYNTTLDSYY